MNGQAESQRRQDSDPYLEVLRSLSPGLIVQFNTSDPSSMTTEEMVVSKTWVGDGPLLESTHERFVIRYEDDNVALYQVRDGQWYEHHYVDITTIEVVADG